MSELKLILSNSIDKLETVYQKFQQNFQKDRYFYVCSTIVALIKTNVELLDHDFASEINRFILNL